MENKVEDAEKKTENVEEKLENAGVEPGDAEKTLGAEKVSEGEEKIKACAERKSESTEEALAHKGETEAAKASSEDVEKKQDKKQDKKDKKNKISRKKVAGGVELAVAFILAALSLGLFFNTRGTRLLYVSVATGRVSRYYWIFFVIAAVFLTVGVFTMRSRRREDKENLLEGAKMPASKTQSEENTDE